MDGGRRLSLAILGVLAATLAACAVDTTTPVSQTQLVSIVPEGGAANVDPTRPVVVTFDHPMGENVTRYAAVHEGDADGPQVPGAWALEGSDSVLVFTPDPPLKPATQYTVCLGAGMMDRNGEDVAFDLYGSMMGGQSVTASTMGGGRQGANGVHGMRFTFTTASP